MLVSLRIYSSLPILCPTVAVPCTNGDLRLVGGTIETEGRVEICYNEEWGTVCDDFWGNNDGGVVCRQLGYAGVIESKLVISISHYRG